MALKLAKNSLFSMRVLIEGKLSRKFGKGKIIQMFNWIINGSKQCFLIFLKLFMMMMATERPVVLEGLGKSELNGLRHSNDQPNEYTGDKDVTVWIKPSIFSVVLIFRKITLMEELFHNILEVVIKIRKALVSLDSLDQKKSLRMVLTAPANLNIPYSYTFLAPTPSSFPKPAGCKP